MPPPCTTLSSLGGKKKKQAWLQAINAMQILTIGISLIRCHRIISSDEWRQLVQHARQHFVAYDYVFVYLFVA